MKTARTISALVVIAITIILAASCGQRATEYKPFDAGVAVIKAKHSVDSMQRAVDARTAAYLQANGQ